MEKDKRMIYQRGVTSKSSTQTLTVADMGDLFCNSSDAQTYTLPAASLGLWYRFNNIGSGAVTVAANSTTIVTALAINTNAICFNNGTTWYGFEAAAAAASTSSGLTEIPGNLIFAMNRRCRYNGK